MRCICEGKPNNMACPVHNYPYMGNWHHVDPVPTLKKETLRNNTKGCSGTGVTGGDYTCASQGQTG